MSVGVGDQPDARLSRVIEITSDVEVRESVSGWFQTIQARGQSTIQVGDRVAADERCAGRPRSSRAGRPWTRAAIHYQ